MGPEPLIRPMRDADAEAVSRIQSAAGEASQWDPRGYLAFEAFVLELDGHIAAFLVIRQTAPDEAEILNIAVDPAHRRRGLARRLLAAAFRQPRTFFLEVRQSNIAAQALYRSLGFHVCGRRPGYYRHPDEPAILMRRD
ncbi:MAG TPA: ribosomal protein S18-alanine N-acetyltransferase [Bryobacteraceae bacterium]|nr:ribosomal-protein-alanine N-acetyltransferase [Bryobacterales bacterium]HRJ21818.1 ribosomal protein S18-alanine N-acetyltransferase [Bryobacteraceae bacterium]